MLEVAFPASLTELLHSALLQPISICKFRRFDLFRAFEYFSPQLCWNPPKICKYLSLCLFGVQIWLHDRLVVFLTPMQTKCTHQAQSQLSMLSISTVQLQDFTAIVRIHIYWYRYCCGLVLDVIVPTCRVLVEQEHLLDLCREQRYDLAEHGLE